MSEETNINKGNPINSKLLASVVTIFENDHFIVNNKKHKYVTHSFKTIRISDWIHDHSLYDFYEYIKM
jgi:hypothetical protein